jgi:hypothetical protein
MSLLDFARDDYSQNGEDGIIERIFSVVSDPPGLCCEFGAWDGIVLSNTRALAERGWRAVMIEADAAKFAELERNYADNPRVVCIRTVVDDGPNRLDRILEQAGISDRLDFLSIDIDGLDYYVLGSLTIRPLCICVEAGGLHPPAEQGVVAREVAGRNVGQPLAAFVRLAEGLGYRLIAHTGNAFFLHKDAGAEDVFPTVEPGRAYEEFVARLSREQREWLYRANLGFEQPGHRFRNPYLSRSALGVPPSRAAHGLVVSAGHRLVSRLSRRVFG